MATVASLTKKAEQCLANATEAPGSPLWLLGKVTAFGAKGDFDKIQKTVDHLTCKAKARLPFVANEREFLKELYEAFWWGGKAKGLGDAAELANHYVNGDGKALRINAEVYRTSVIVRDVSIGMKEYLRSVWSRTKKTPAVLQSSDAAFRQSTQFKALAHGGGRSQQYQGILLAEGTLLAEQANVRLQKADNRFYLKAFLSPLPEQKLQIRWRVDSVYDFEPFEKKDYVTRLPIGEWVLALPDGLSQYMTVLGVAKAFDYYAEWHEIGSL